MESFRLTRMEFPTSKLKGMIDLIWAVLFLIIFGGPGVVYVSCSKYSIVRIDFCIEIFFFPFLNVVLS
jgi:hypothetical protein